MISETQAILIMCATFGLFCLSVMWQHDIEKKELEAKKQDGEKK